MIFVAVGTQKFSFNRLLKTLDQLVADAIITEEVFAQIGHSTYKPINFAYKDFLSQSDFASYISSCDLLITHSGVATIIAGVKNEKSVIVMPRLSKFKEHVDDHQIQIADFFSEGNLVLKCSEQDDLGNMIEEAKKHKFDKYVSNRKLVINTIRDFMKSI